MGGDFSSLRVQPGPGVHSTSYKMSTGEFPGVKAAEHRTIHPISSKLVRGCEYVDPWTHMPGWPLWPVLRIPLPSGGS